MIRPAPISRIGARTRALAARRRALTLVEAAVVTGLVGLLAAVLLPALGAAREEARIRQCLANMRAIGAASNAYLTEFNSLCFSLPSPYHSGGSTFSFSVYTEYLALSAMPDKTPTALTADDDGRPGVLTAGPYRTGDGTLTLAAAATGDVTAGALRQIEYSAEHTPAPLLGGRRYWVAVAAEGESAWRWSFAEAAAGNDIAFNSAGDVRYRGRMADDLAFCLDLASTAPAEAPVADALNQSCDTAIEIASNALVTVDNRGSNGSATAPAGISALQGLVWYSFVATHTSVRMTLRGSGGAPGALLIEKGAAGDCALAGTLRAITYDDSFAADATGLTVGRRYFLAIGATSDLGRGAYRLRLSSPIPPSPVNALCTGAIAVGVPSQTPGSNRDGVGAGDYDAIDGVHYSGPGVWYRFTGTGADVTLSLDNGALDFPARLSVFSGSCSVNDALHTRVAAVDGRVATPAVTVPTQAGVDYYVVVHGYRGAEGNFRLDLCAPDSPIDLDDLLLVLGNFGCAFDCHGDLDGDGDTDLDDLLTVLAYFERSCGPLPGSLIAPPLEAEAQLGG